MKIQLKRSSVLDGGAAKEPTAAQMEYGELAVNYSETDPAIFLKDAADNIIRISGVGNISDDGQVEVPSTVNPPLNPSDGNLWYNADDGRLYVYYNDGNSSQWVDASPDGWNEQEALGGYVEKAGDNMTGDLTLGTDKITLDATDGSITAAGSINTESEVKTTRFGTPASLGAANDAAIRVGTSADTKAKIGYDGSATFLSLNPIVKDQPSSGNVANPAIQIKHNGTINGSWRHDGRFEVGGQDSNAEITLSPDGSITAAGNIYTPKSSINFKQGNTGECLAVYEGLSTDSAAMFAVNNDGSAEFAGDVAIGGHVGNHTVDGVWLESSGDIRVTGSSSNTIWAGYQNGTAAATSTITADGNAEFAGNTQVGGALYLEGSAGTQSEQSELLNTASSVDFYASRSSTVNKDFKFYSNNTVGSNYITFKSDGNIRAAGYSMANLPQI